MIPSKKQYEEAHERHIILWDWCAKHPTKEKDDCPMWEENGGEWEENENACFACEVCDQADLSCTHCPIDWGVESCCTTGSPYLKWADSESMKTRKKYAALIRDAKWTPYEEWIKIKD